MQLTLWLEAIGIKTKFDEEVDLRPNAQAHLLPEACARASLPLPAVRCSALFGAFPGLSSPQFPISLRAFGLSRFASERLRLSR